MAAAAPTTAADLGSRSRRDLAAAEALVGRIERGSGSDRASVLEPYDEAWLLLSTVGAESGLLREVHPDPDVRKVAEDLGIEVTALRTRMQHSRALYDAIGRVGTSTPDEARLVDVVRTEMRLAGVELDAAGRERVRALREELTKLGQEFERNVRDDVRTIELAPSRLAGMPADFVRGHPAGADGKVRLTTDYPDYIPFMAYADDGAARKEFHRTFLGRAVPRNLEVLRLLLERKHELARLLGHRSYADLQTELTIAGSAKGVRTFLNEVRDIARERAKVESATLLELKRKAEPGATSIGEWELSYWLEKARAAEVGFDAREARPYFEYRAVRQAILDLNSELFGMRFEKAKDEMWHPSVETFDVEIDGAPPGRISLDMHPRAAKFNHAANFGYRPGAAGKQVPHSVLVCNFPDPGATQGPALMEHREVVTYFHEFGHLVQSLMRGGVPWARLGRPVEFDFIEAPSQFLEQWIFDHGVLTRFAKHVETGQPISEKMVDRLRAARDFGRGVNTQRQLFLSIASLEFHDNDPREVDTTRMWQKLAKEWSPVEIDPETRFEASWTHMPDYAALYATYTISKTVAESLSSGMTNGLMDLRQTMRYRDIVLGQGGLKPALTLVEEFLGRPHDLSAYRKWLS